MDKQAQDKDWSVLNQGNKEKLIDFYKWCKVMDYEKTAGALEEQFGSHNLNPEPPTPKTWEEVEKEYGDEVYSQWGKLGADITASRPSEKVIDKCVATLKIAKLIELGYGGMVSEEEYDTKVFWNIVANRQDKKAKLNIVSNYDAIGNILTFRSYELAYEFMSHESNRKLVEQYYLL